MSVATGIWAESRGKGKKCVPAEEMADMLGLEARGCAHRAPLPGSRDRANHG
jgi:hypothetical protein